MRTILLILITGICISCTSQDSSQKASPETGNSSDASAISKEYLFGAWEAQETTDSGTVVTHMMTFTDKYFSEAIYVNEPANFISTSGGSWNLMGSDISLNYEYFSNDTSQVGESAKITVNIKGAEMEAADLTWKKVDAGSPGDLQGAWLITGRKREGEISRRTPGERKTMKILSGTRFQWIAYHTGTGRFSGTGGGTYTTVEGKYTENIEFFSRDNSRVGASLEFEYALDSGEWHHSGLSSKGSPIYEIWTPRSMLEE